MFTGYKGGGVSSASFSLKKICALIGVLGFLCISAAPTTALAVAGDQDDDGVADEFDNCVDVPNEFQEDTDYDGIGNACDTSEGDCFNFEDDDNDFLWDCEDPDCATDLFCVDTDGDFWPDAFDNCPTVPNEFQEDSDFDGVGDACPDADHDGLFDFDDNCPMDFNENQEDTDKDGIGNVCDTVESNCINGISDDDDDLVDCDDPDCAEAQVCLPSPDSDGDGVPNGEDNCRNAANPDQADNDGDGAGNACDRSPDGGEADDTSNLGTDNASDSGGCSIGARPYKGFWGIWSSSLALGGLVLTWRFRNSKRLHMQ